jgi:polyhydroxyalkanoate synthesis regulator phasin
LGILFLSCIGESRDMRRINLNTAKKTVALAHKTWLAGLGAYDSGRESTANKLDQLFVDGSAFVNDLLEKGESVEAQLQAKIEARKMLKDKISALRAKLSFGNDSRDQQIDDLSQRVDNLIEVVAKLAQQKAAENKSTTIVPVEKTPAKAAAKTVAKASATKASKPAAAKPAAAKPTAVKPAAAKPTAVKPAAAKPAAVKPAAAKPAAVKSAAAKPAAVKPAAAISASEPKADDKD